MAVAPISQTTGMFGERVRKRRNELGMSQEQAALKCGIHWTFLGQVERGQRNVSLHNITKIAAGLQIDPAVLVSELPPPEGP